MKNNKSMYEVQYDFDMRVYDTIVALEEKHNHAIAIFGGALYACEFVKSEKLNIEAFVEYLVHIPQNVILFKWHEGIAGALRRFCHICLVDPALIEAYLGMRFSDVEALYKG